MHKCPFVTEKCLNFNTLNQALESDEDDIVDDLYKQILFLENYNDNIRSLAEKWAKNVRKKPINKLSIESFLNLYPIHSPQGSALMSLSEAYLRIPDKESKTKLISDKIISNNWQTNPDATTIENLTINTLSLVKKITPKSDESKPNYLQSLVHKSSSIFIRTSVRKMLDRLSDQFILQTTIEKAFKKSCETADNTYSFDMLGEGARTQKDADTYYQAYLDAITHLGKELKNYPFSEFFKKPSISIKLSALHPKYDPLKIDRVLNELVPKLHYLMSQAKSFNVSVTIDAEETERLYLSLHIFEMLFEHPDFANWNGMGLAVQAYHKASRQTIFWLKELAQKHNKIIPIRLVKGAYWDSEIKLAQQKGLKNFPVFTRKASTDLSYLACANILLQNTNIFYPQFATHNLQTISSILSLVEHYKKPLKLSNHDFEFQRLHGMGAHVFEVLKLDYSDITTRIYAPVGSKKDLLSYLVRRLLENGANGSFLNQLSNNKVPIEQLIINPLCKVKSYKQVFNSKISLPSDIFHKTHQNSIGLDIKNWFQLDNLYAQMSLFEKKVWIANPLLKAKIKLQKKAIPIVNPANRNELVGNVTQADEEIVKLSLLETTQAYKEWRFSSVEDRAQMLETFAKNLELESPLLITILARESGKTLSDAIDEIREAVDFCRYYAHQARRIMSKAQELQGPTGELNELSFAPRGVFVCISPWNFPLAIFIGQIAAALATGNCVIAKPASQTPLIAYEAVKIAHKSGFPKDVLNFLPCSAAIVSKNLLSSPDIAGVVFTGSNETAAHINLNLAHKTGPIVPFIAETGGINAMIVDSSALPEQVIDDVLASGVKSAGQRCSALRILFIQKDVFPKFSSMLGQAITELKIGNPLDYDTDVGPIIDQNSKQALEKHLVYLQKINAQLIGAASIDSNLQNGNFFAPQIWQLKKPQDLRIEIFGPIIHVVTFDVAQFNNTIDIINNFGFGLTLGIHSRIDSRINYVRKHAKVGNIYVNRNMIGAVVGAQPFGGEGLSGTGPKAGGPNYLYRFLTERTFTNNITASGGNASLICLQDD